MASWLHGFTNFHPDPEGDAKVKAQQDASTSGVAVPWFFWVGSWLPKKNAKVKNDDEMNF